MHKTPLVSIIIPTYNRAHLIGETLESVMAQTYVNWECIVVDDGSTDNTTDILQKFINKDNRIQQHQRPSNRAKGANACRNYGLELSKGEYVNWFDSDDLMLPEFLEVKIKTLIEGHLDFVFSHSENIDENGKISQIYTESNLGKEINAYNYIKQHIGWITIDFMVKKATINIRFNEQLKSGQEYNFISRYLFYTTNGVFVNKTLAYRRVHSASIQSKVTKSEQSDMLNYLKQTVDNKFILLKDIISIGDASSKNYLINSLIWFSYRLVQEHRKLHLNSRISVLIFKLKGIKYFIQYVIAIFLSITLGRGYNFMKRAKA
jgi:glycosyltransferase involved in cell wall biosynthesis